MWLNTIVGRAGGGAASKALSTVRYSSIGLHERSASGQIILPLDVEETVTCFCRFDLCITYLFIYFLLSVLLCFYYFFYFIFFFFFSLFLSVFVSKIYFTPLFIHFSLDFSFAYFRLLFFFWCKLLRSGDKSKNTHLKWFMALHQMRVQWSCNVFFLFFFSIFSKFNFFFLCMDIKSNFHLFPLRYELSFSKKI